MALRMRKGLTQARGKPQGDVRAAAGQKETKRRSAPADFDAQQYLVEKAKAVEQALEKTAELHYPQKISEAMRYSLLGGGKRIRPVLCIAACEMTGGSQRMALPAACAVELMHTMSLVHDDLPAMDNDDFRRGQPTNHKQFGEDFAILAGDALLAKSFEVVAAASPDPLTPDRANRVLLELSQAAGSRGLVGGQALDILTERGEIDRELPQLEFIHEHKTARLLKAAVVCGAISAGAPDDHIQRLALYGRNLGVGFQVVDDVLDVTSTSEQLGKTAGKDDAAGKATYPSLLGIEESKRVATELIEGAKEQLDAFDRQLAAPLLSLADFITARTS